MRPSKRLFHSCDATFKDVDGLCCLCSLKAASPQRQEQARIEVENAEDDLVQKTEVAITLMKTVLENVMSFFSFFSLIIELRPLQPEPIKNLNELAKAQVSA